MRRCKIPANENAFGFSFFPSGSPLLSCLLFLLLLLLFPFFSPSHHLPPLSSSLLFFVCVFFFFCFFISITATCLAVCLLPSLYLLISVYVSPSLYSFVYLCLRASPSLYSPSCHFPSLSYARYFFSLSLFLSASRLPKPFTLTFPSPSPPRHFLSPSFPLPLRIPASPILYSSLSLTLLLSTSYAQY